MKIIKGKPGTGKTDELINLALSECNNNVEVVVKDDHTRHKVLQKIGYGRLHVITHSDYILNVYLPYINGTEPLSTTPCNIYIDDADLLDNQFTDTLYRRIKAITVTED